MVITNMWTLGKRKFGPEGRIRRNKKKMVK